MRKPGGRRRPERPFYSRPTAWEGGRTSHLERLLRFTISDSPPPPPAAPEKTEIAEMQPSCAKFSNPDSGQSGGGDAPIADYVPSGWSAELRGGSGVAAPIGRRQTFEIVPQVVTAPFFKFSTFRLGAVGAATLLPSRRLLPLRCRVAGRRSPGPTPRATIGQH